MTKLGAVVAAAWALGTAQLIRLEGEGDDQVYVWDIGWHEIVRLTHEDVRRWPDGRAIIVKELYRWRRRKIL